MTVNWYSHPSGFDHVTPAGHPERVARLEAVEGALLPLDPDRVQCPRGRDEDILLCHPERYLARVIEAEPAQGYASLDGDTHLAPGSVEAARHAVGGAVAAVDAVLDGAARAAFVGCRPPGHHAETETAMGFCLFGTAAIAARHALSRRGLGRVAILDFDVHHGNGTQALLWHERAAFFASSHQMPLFPGTGSPSEEGAHGQIVNTPLSAYSGRSAMRAAWDERIFPALRAHEPELIVVSAGFDAHADDPLAMLEWTVDDFAWITGRICDMAEDLCEGRIVSTLEGGYDLNALGASVAAHVRVLQERSR